jgi:hypothetical protein
MARPSWAAKEKAYVITVSWSLRPNGAKRDPTPNNVVLYEALNPASWKLHGSSSSHRLLSHTVIVESENPHQVQQSALHSSLLQSPESDDMAF